jgi:hypothetical protein
MSEKLFGQFEQDRIMHGRDNFRKHINSLSIIYKREIASNLFPERRGAILGFQRNIFFTILL